MVDVMWLLIAAVCAMAGMGMLALSLEPHWRQVTATPAPASLGKTTLRVLGGITLVGALIFCLAADHATMAVLVWIMFLAAAAFTVGMLLTWFPAILRPLSSLATQKRPS